MRNRTSDATCQGWAPSSGSDTAQLWYVLGMTKKIAVSLPDRTLERAKIAVKRGKAPNVSNYIARLIDQANTSESFDEMIADFVKKSGAGENETRAAERQALKEFEKAGLPTQAKHREAASRKAG